jgi:hypothetical protein
MNDATGWSEAKGSGMPRDMDPHTYAKILLRKVRHATAEHHPSPSAATAAGTEVRCGGAQVRESAKPIWTAFCHADRAGDGTVALDAFDTIMHRFHVDMGPRHRVRPPRVRARPSAERARGNQRMRKGARGGERWSGRLSVGRGAQDELVAQFETERGSFDYTRFMSFCRQDLS